MLKALLLSDLHKDIRDKFAEDEQNRWIRSLLTPDVNVVIITGDVFEYTNYKNIHFNPYEYLDNLFVDLPVICCLGNHEFAMHEVDEILDFFYEKYNAKSTRTHFLDICGYHDIGNIRFVGNCLWYDGSLKTVANQKMYDWANGTWFDRHIVNLRFERENERCRIQISNNIDADKTNVLCTHCVPHEKLNGWMTTERSFGNEYNAYSGMDDLLSKLPEVKYAICGHTHKYVVCEIDGKQCYNIGNDYHPPFTHKIIEIEDKNEKENLESKDLQE